MLQASIIFPSNKRKHTSYSPSFSVVNFVLCWFLKIVSIFDQKHQFSLENFFKVNTYFFTSNFSGSPEKSNISCISKFIAPHFFVENDKVSSHFTKCCISVLWLLCFCHSYIPYWRQCFAPPQLVQILWDM